MGDVSVCVVVGIGRSVKGIARCMDSHESKSVMDGIEQRLFSWRRHGRVLIRPYCGQVSGGKEEYRSVLPKILGVENPAVLRGGHIKAILFSERSYRLFQNPGLVAHGLHYVVLEA